MLFLLLVFFCRLNVENWSVIISIYNKNISILGNVWVHIFISFFLSQNNGLVSFVAVQIYSCLQLYTENISVLGNVLLA